MVDDGSEREKVCLCPRVDVDFPFLCLNYIVVHILPEGTGRRYTVVAGDPVAVSLFEITRRLLPSGPH